jgi:16S rRNA (guanine966-N2)-methyltransferase
MRIISGTAGGLTIQVPKSLTRPTTDKVRQAIFSMLGETVIEARVLDLFAGSGALGLECLSRGAESCLFIDQQRQACDIIKTNLTRTRLQDGTVRAGEVMKMLAELVRIGQDRFDLILADPPYQHEQHGVNWAQALLDSADLPPLMNEHASLVLEYAAGSTLSVDESKWTLVRDKEYGGTRVCWLKKREFHADA